MQTAMVAVGMESSTVMRDEMVERGVQRGSLMRGLLQRRNISLGWEAGGQMRMW